MSVIFDGRSNRILLTGASGFVGRTLLAVLSQDASLAIFAPTRMSLSLLPSGTANPIIRGIDHLTDWRSALSGVETVIHCASRVHVMSETAANPLAEFRRVNVDGTRNLAEQAAAAGVKRFIFLSSIKVNGEATLPGRPFSANDIPNPCDVYGISKLEAERVLMDVTAQTGMEFVIIRPPLIYGPGVKANFLTMMQWVCKGYPLPFGAIGNKRSLVGIDNLVSLIVECAVHPLAANQIFLVSDGDDFSTPQLLRAVGNALGRPARLFPIPPGVLRATGAILGKSGVMERLCRSLQIDIAKNRTLIGWQPPFSVGSGLQKTARHFLDSL